MFIVPKIYVNQLAMTHCDLVMKKIEGTELPVKKRDEEA